MSETGSLSHLVVVGAPDGGRVVMQDPESAAFDGGIPGSLAPDTVDIAAPPERIGPPKGDPIAGVGGQPVGGGDGMALLQTVSEPAG